MSNSTNERSENPERSTPTTSQEDTPSLFGEEVTAEMQRKVAPAREAVQKKLREIETPEQASEVADQLMQAADDTTELTVREEQLREEDQPQPEAAIQAAAATLGSTQTAETIVEVARQMAGSSGALREALEQAVQEATNPEQHGNQDSSLQKPLEMLREEVLQRMQPLQSLDARLFMAINHMPHTALSNQLMSTLTDVMNAGFGYVAGLIVAAALDRPRGHRALHSIVPPLWFTTMAIEFPIKRYFKRERPFIDLVQAISVGKKPGNYSFPSGHSASAFAGAWLLCKYYPELTPLWYTIAVLVGFSRIYLGAHYPGDVVSGAAAGTAIAEATHWFIEQSAVDTEPAPPAQLVNNLIAAAREKVFD